MSDDNRNSDEGWLEKTRSRLDACEDEIDGVTLGRLRAARREALSRAGTYSRVEWRRHYWAPAAVLIAIVAFNISPMKDPDIDVESIAAFEDLLLLSSESELEMLGDLEFFIWVAEAEQELG